MADQDLVLQSQHWYDRAVDKLAMARDASEPHQREHLFRIARSYQQLAERLEDWNAAREGQQKGERIRP